MTKKLIVANWKILPKTLADAEGILERVNDYLESLGETKEFSLVFCPPSVFLEEVGKILTTSHFEHEASLGAQDTAEDLKKLNVRYVIVGHSDRRWGLGESDEIVNEKLKLVLQNEMIPVVCLGERTRDGDYKSFLENQTLKTFDGLSADDIGKCIIAYEPVWAISTELNAKPDTPESAIESIKIIRDFLISDRRLAIGDLRILYGGSVNSQNIRDFIIHDEISGVLVGGASVDKEEFVKILEVVSKNL
ncbi:MAG: Triosephosphate isomerase [Candidatus Yanofskybacteria bacterium GW2011_GWA2_41_22]|uniref:Triosephosphate isomerase n=5 Tax=Parcubacteria group TaxID=1794811 RepID=A0A1F8HV22_9BACT|nr:MAG: Triosephosphate isomerase [Candidatus Yanofskybacteria bacterium GW2011_GWA2_41_22]KKS23628.1 MAG: Triosephosphate isomerase [Candidatus Jorgensenbacteria bacterium GW2011_GWF2_41_8]KKU16405.1 MAG: Triosephosphate isomerase [Candidatus Giovannonibacteria bacterium GW2011_GWB1_45_9b]OGM98885.1 MAG: hypothetical protein A2736_02990 [Candidatus Yanofskybacteria bacterium RIFCSPHIGHO2_01_FULL_41_27]OGN19865.1 MAG: hypothetical protein A3B00_02350 [Candidatus Yanofskybacteria bacterium RIFCS